MSECLDFDLFSGPVAAQFSLMTAPGMKLFRTNLSGDELWETYIEAFPAEHNKLFRERREYDCNCCRSFIKRVGGVVAIDKNLNRHTIWDVTVPGYFQQVADKLSALVKADKLSALAKNVEIDTQFLINERFAGSNPTPDNITPALIWKHFNVSIPNQFFAEASEIGPKTSNMRTDFSVAYRGVSEFSLDSAETALELALTTLYRGEEHVSKIKNFINLKKKFDKLSGQKAVDFIRYKAAESGSAIRFRSTVIGTLVEDIENGVDLEVAVRKFEEKVAPSNYQRTSAVVTKSMVEKARKTIEEKGYGDSIERRHATVSDIPSDALLFTSTPDKAFDVFDEIAQESNARVKSGDKTLKNVQEISASEFVEKVLPSAKGVEVLLPKSAKKNFFSLTAPAVENCKPITKWSNNLGWSFVNDTTDAVRERVKREGGRVDNVDARFSLIWYNRDDLDLSLVRLTKTGKKSRDILYYGNKRMFGAELDIDMNAGFQISDEPVENIFFEHLSSAVPGQYMVVVHQFQNRSIKNVGFQLQYQSGSETTDLFYKKKVSGRIDVMKVEITPEKEIRVLWVNDEELEGGDTIVAGEPIEDFWGVGLGGFVPVESIINSPNHWPGEKEHGLKHYMFKLADCKNPDQPRGFYNEFLADDLKSDRKFFEVLAGKMLVPESNDQFSGVSFSQSSGSTVVVRVQGKSRRTFKVKF